MLPKKFIQRVIGPYTRCLDENKGEEYLCSLAEYCCEDGCCDDKPLDNRIFLGGALCILVFTSVLWCYYTYRKKQGTESVSQPEEVQCLCKLPVKQSKELVVNVKKDTKVDMEPSGIGKIPRPTNLERPANKVLSKITLLFPLIIWKKMSERK